MILSRDRLNRTWFRLLSMLGEEHRRLKTIKRDNLLVVINLHHVSPEPNPFWSPLHPRLFEELLRFVVPRFRVTTFAGLGESGDARPPMVLSFDDGYYDYVEYALPLLHQYRVPSNQNIITDCVLSGQPPRLIQLCDFLGQAPRNLIDEVQLPGFEHQLRDNSIEEKIHYGNALTRFIKMRSHIDEEPLWAALEPTMKKLTTLRPSRMMLEADIAGVTGEHEIGCHSASHQSMEFETDSFFLEDLNSCTAFFNNLRLPLRVYAFPNGSWRPELVQILLQRGVEHALLVGDSYASPHSQVKTRFNYYAGSASEGRLRALGYTTQSSGLRTLASRLPWRN